MKALVAVSTLLAVLAAIGCGESAGGSGMKPTMTIEDANKKVEQHIQRAVNVLPESAKLTDEYITPEQECDDPTDQGPRGRVFATHDYEVVGLDKAKTPEYFDTLKKWWLENGYAVIDDDAKDGFLGVENEEDAVRVTLKTSPNRRILLIASSPCVWPDGTPAPEDS